MSNFETNVLAILENFGLRFDSLENRFDNFEPR